MRPGSSLPGRGGCVPWRWGGLHFEGGADRGCFGGMITMRMAWKNVEKPQEGSEDMTAPLSPPKWPSCIAVTGKLKFMILRPLSSWASVFHLGLKVR